MFFNLGFYGISVSKLCHTKRLSFVKFLQFLARKFKYLKKRDREIRHFLGFYQFYQTFYTFDFLTASKLWRSAVLEVDKLLFDLNFCRFFSNLSHYVGNRLGYFQGREDTHAYSRSALKFTFSPVLRQYRDVKDQFDVISHLFITL